MTGKNITICGSKGHGKDTVADVFVEMWGYEKRSFADPMKRMLHEGFGIPFSRLYGNDEAKAAILPEYGVSVRHMLQTLGTEWGRDLIQKDVWVRATLAFMRDVEACNHATHVSLGHAPPQVRWVVPDTRRRNELDALVDRGFKVIRVTRPGYGGTAGSGHVSEAGIPGLSPDVRIVNDGTLHQLESAAVKAWHHLANNSHSALQVADTLVIIASTL